MRKNIKRSYNFKIYANHLNSRKIKTNNIDSIKHTMNIDSFCADLENFYALHPNFFVEECNLLMRTQNCDYTKYEKWITDD